MQENENEAHQAFAKLPIKISISRLSFAPLQNTDFRAGIYHLPPGVLRVALYMIMSFSDCGPPVKRCFSLLLHVLPIFCSLHFDIGLGGLVVPARIMLLFEVG